MSGRQPKTKLLTDDKYIHNLASWDTAIAFDHAQWRSRFNRINNFRSKRRKRKSVWGEAGIPRADVFRTVEDLVK